MLADLTGFQRDLLVILSGMETPSGSEIMQEIQNAQDRSVLHGQLYKNSNGLVEEGYVKKGEFDGRTNYYTVTDERYEKPQDRHSGNESTSRLGRMGAPINSGPYHNRGKYCCLYFDT